MMAGEVGDEFNGPSNDPRSDAQFRILLRRHLTRAGNFVNLAVANGATTKAVTLVLSEENTSYGVTVVPNWDTRFWVTAKTVSGFTINFSSAAGASATVDVSTFRSA